MPSRALKRWESEQRHKLDELEIAQRAIGGTGPGRRYLTQLNHAYLVMLAAQWQDFCRQLHEEAADAIAGATQPPTVRAEMYRATLNDVKVWRHACNALAREMDRAVAVRVIALVGQLPW